MKVVYIAGPFRSKTGSYWEQEQNIRRAEEVALQVWRAGAVALCPHMNTWHFQGAAPDETWLQGDLELLKRCDGIVMMKTWRASSGATHEHIMAVSYGLKVFYEMELDLCQFINWVKEETNEAGRS